MEGLTALINDCEEKKLIKGIRVAREAPSILHIFFVDDSYIFCKENNESARHMLTLLSVFEKASGQQINANKSSVVFSKNTEITRRNDMCQILGFQEARDRSLYLGLPIVVGRNKRAIFGFLKDKLQERVQGWDKKLLSKAGKEILLKTVAQALPNHSMFVFLLPIGLCKEIERVMCKFWWNNNAKKNKSIHWKSWENMSTRKSLGGMGFRNLRDFNIALLGNQGWRLIQYPDKLVSKVFKARYYSDGSFLNAKLGHNPSFVWRSILEAQPLLKQGLGCRVGNGASINVVTDLCLPMKQAPYIRSHNEALTDQKVRALMNLDGTGWDTDLILDIFVEDKAYLILSIPVHPEERDRWYWRKEKLGTYSVKSAYSLIQDSKTQHSTIGNSGLWRRLWNLQIPPKIKSFLWRACSECFPTKDLLRARRVQVNILCSVCNESPEFILHCLITCPFANTCLYKLGITTISGEFHSSVGVSIEG